jgi:diaminohydroxyphosphoribosylaminopyrimidine deaminase/5-amino-6-(5-phosphoribosylamino)uracil reductase
VLQQLHERGVRTLLMEGGPRVNAGFLGQGLIDEVFWTVGAKLIGNDALPMIARVPSGSPMGQEPLDGRLVSIHRHGDELFLRYRFG